LDAANGEASSTAAPVALDRNLPALSPAP
jgi:hypothetical protein